MDAFFIFVVIYIIYSVISKVARSAQQGFPQPPAAPRPAQRAETVLQEILGQWEEARREDETARPYLELPPQQGGYTQHGDPNARGYSEEATATQQPHAAPTIVIPTEKRPGKRVSSPPLQAPRSREAFPAARPKRTPKPAAPASGLEQLLSRENLPQAVIAAEVLAAPRCKRPLLRRGI